MTGKNFITYKCNKCLRSKDIQQDNSTYFASIQNDLAKSSGQAITNFNAFIDRCTITKNCTGKLIPLSSKSSSSLVIEKHDTLQDWTPRTLIQQIAEPEVQLEYFNLSSSENLHLSIISKNTFSEPVDSFTLKFNVQSQNAQPFVEYEYYMSSSFTFIVGPDTSNSSKVLKFLLTDIVQVFINGVKLIENTDYILRYSNDVGYQIDFTKAYQFNNIVKILVFKAVELVETQSITFTRNHLVNSSISNSWNNVISTNFGDSNSSLTFNIAQSQLSFLNTYQINYLNLNHVIVFINNIKLTNTQYTLQNGQITINYNFTYGDILKVFENGVPLLITPLQSITSSKIFVDYDKNNISVFLDGVSINEISGITYTADDNQSITLFGSLNYNSQLQVYSQNRYYVYTCTDVSLLPINKLLTLYNKSSLSNNVGEIDEFYFLLSYPPYTVSDRIYTAVVPLFSEETCVIRILSTSSQKSLQVSKFSIQYLSYPITILQVDNPSLEILTTSSQDTKQLLPPSTKIIGPV